MSQKRAEGGAEVVARLDAELLRSAQRFGHHGLTDFIEIVRQFHNMAITEEYSRDLLKRGGYPQA